MRSRTIVRIARHTMGSSCYGTWLVAAEYTHDYFEMFITHTPTKILAPLLKVSIFRSWYATNRRTRKSSGLSIISSYCPISRQKLCVDVGRKTRVDKGGPGFSLESGKLP
jgi:hypothetical protein